MEIIVVDLRGGFRRLALYCDHRIEFAFLELLERDPLFDVDEVCLDSEALENNDRGYERAAVRQIDGHCLAFEIAHRLDRLARDHMHFFEVELGDVRELPFNVAGDPLLLQIIERVGSHDPNVDTLEEQNVGNALNRPPPHDRQHPKLIAVVEYGCEIGAKLHVSAADRSRHQGDRV